MTVKEYVGTLELTIMTLKKILKEDELDGKAKDDVEELIETLEKIIAD